MASISDKLMESVRSSAAYNANVQVAPACILWPDGDRQWEPVVPRLLQELPELCVLGDYDPAQRTGPAIWLRVVIADKAEDTKLPSDRKPILYLPGVRRQDLRAVENCPDHLKPLAELQYRGVIWSQMNAKDWTILAFLQSRQGGLGLDVAADNEAKRAMRLALFRLLDERLELLDGKHLDKDYFNKLLTSGDPIREVLQWIDDPAGFRDKCDENAWRAFGEICKSQLKLSPERDGELEAAGRLAEKAPPWDSVWERFAEAPSRYPNIPQQIRKTAPPKPKGLFDDLSGWPQWNDGQEEALRGELTSLSELTPEQARSKVLALNKSHGERRSQVWASLGMSPLAVATEHLAGLAQVTSDSIAAGTAEDMLAAYQASAWRADDRLLRSLEAVQTDSDLNAVETALRALYLPWATEAAHHLQKVVSADGYPGKSATDLVADDSEAGVCYLFIDGLRLDLAKRLAEKLEEKSLTVSASVGWSALPSVTSTAKPAVTPVRRLIQGADANKDFTPEVAASGKSLQGGYQLQKLLEEQGWQKLSKTENGDSSGRGWCEMGDIDHEGHERGWKLARHIDLLLNEAVERAQQLLAAGWKQIRIVTDHGWLLMPGGLPKTPLAASLSENKWGRCAALKPGASTDEQLFPWFWNPSQCFALAEGVSCYREGVQYAHGGLSLQECVTMSLVVAGGAAFRSVRIVSVEWKQLRCKVELAEPVDGVTVDIRTHAANPATSQVAAKKQFTSKAACSVVMQDEDLEGHEVWVVLLDDDGALLAQQSTIVAEDN
ncbi:BREX-1 system phosphatase PglZ type B [Botrimarina hoheduenensis]|uniref:PglZ domain protein n=1 Tax=Botrimarina hoheduenensis TaxID=2528000 RepID=A0A5C5WEA4_9BACT|nr:BREX-1 system phosphatase PglZ type B [Botrimarina hoheduenensis]TWT48940.1 hypothetical protein Pla111_07180 [Botrimarina hoheduenensis]